MITFEEFQASCILLGKSLLILDSAWQEKLFLKNESEYRACNSKNVTTSN